MLDFSNCKKTGISNLTSATGNKDWTKRKTLPPPLVLLRRWLRLLVPWVIRLVPVEGVLAVLLGGRVGLAATVAVGSGATAVVLLAVVALPALAVVAGPGLAAAPGLAALVLGVRYIILALKI